MIAKINIGLNMQLTYYVKLTVYLLYDGHAHA